MEKKENTIEQFLIAPTSYACMARKQNIYTHSVANFSNPLNAFGKTFARRLLAKFLQGKSGKKR